MRAAVLHFSFAGLLADRAETSAAESNPASLGVTRKLGYKPNGTRVHAVEGKTRLELCFVLERADWEQRRRDDIEIESLGPCLALFGARSPEEAPVELG
jgi:RimJ/RimL family protein N-acetyltransferase